jgi:hypothetical protein
MAFVGDAPPELLALPAALLADMPDAPAALRMAEFCGG